jgi:hypothetical protein
MNKTGQNHNNCNDSSQQNFGSDKLIYSTRAGLRGLKSKAIVKGGVPQGGMLMIPTKGLLKRVSLELSTSYGTHTYKHTYKGQYQRCSTEHGDNKSDLC